MEALNRNVVPLTRSEGFPGRHDVFAAVRTWAAKRIFVLHRSAVSTVIEEP
jgi:hypothetical protein